MIRTVLALFLLLGASACGSFAFRDDRDATSQLEEIASAHGLDGTVEGRFVGEGGDSLRFAHWAAAEPRTGTAVFVSGRTEFIEKNIQTYVDLIGRGFDVWTFDWRGQGLSNRYLEDPSKGYIDSYDTFLADLDLFLTNQVQLDPAETNLLVGHSMGGHVGLRYLHEHRHDFDYAAFSAPMVNLNLPLRPVINAGNWIKAEMGFGKTYTVVTGPFRPWFDDPCAPPNGEPDGKATKRVYQYTHDLDRARQIACYLDRTPRLALGGPTSAWTRRSFESIAVLDGHADPDLTTVPILIVGAGEDTIVDTAAQADWCGRAGDRCTFACIPAASHEILIETTTIRAPFLRDLDGLISGSPPDQRPCDQNES